MSKPLPSVSKLSRVEEIGNTTEDESAPSRMDHIVYAVTDVENENSSQNQLVKYRPHINEPVQTRDQHAVHQQFDAIWDPARNRDVTVHLKLDVHEDFSDTLEEFCRLQRLGDFTSARSYFEEHLSDNWDDPYVRVQYGEMLLEQGDYLSISKLGPLNQYKLGEQGTERQGMLLHDYWDLILFFAECHSIPRRQKDFALNKETLGLLRENVMEVERDITSTEVKYLALIYHLRSLWHPEAVRKDLAATIERLFPPSFHETLYQSLLRQGRIWDLRDIVVARMATGSPWKTSAAWSTNPDFQVRLHALVAGWTNQGTQHDMPTLLALLDMLTSLVCWDEFKDIIPDILTVASQIVHLIIDHHRKAVKTRSYLHWMLVLCESAELGSRHQLRRQEDHLDSSPGILYRRTRRYLAQYAPYKIETPGWICEDGPPVLRDSTNMVLRTSANLGDYRTQAKALQLLILISASPVEEFEKLGKLQKLSQGDNYNFAETLAAKYAVSNDDVSRRKLRDELAAQWSIPGVSNSFSAHQLWILSMIRYALARDDMEGERALSDAAAWYKISPSKFVEHVNMKMPTQRAVDEGNKEAQAARLRPTGMRDNRRNPSFSSSPEPRERFNMGGYGYGTRAFEDTRGEASDHEWRSKRERVRRLKNLAEFRDEIRGRRRPPLIERRIMHRSDESPDDDDSYRNKLFGATRLRRRSRDRDLEPIEPPYRRPQFDESNMPENQPPTGKPSIPGKETIQNDPGRPDATVNQSAQGHPQAPQPRLNQSPAVEDFAARGAGGRGKLQPGNEDKQDGKDTTHHDAATQTDIDTIKPLSRTVTMESVRDVGEETERVGSPISTDDGRN